MTKKEKDPANTTSPNTEGEAPTNKNNPTTNIYQKIQLIQSEIKNLVRSEENKFQKYKYFDELQVLDLLKPLLNKHQLTILMSDDPSKDFYCEPSGNMWLVKYGKVCEIINSIDPYEKLTFSFWASALNQDPAKAKGSAETYGIKYFLSKFFLIPVKDEEDPDSFPEQGKGTTSSPQPSKKTIVFQQAEELYNLFVKKRGTDLTIQTEFLNFMDRVMSNYNLVGKTNTGNFRLRLATLTPTDYQTLMNYLNKLLDKE